MTESGSILDDFLESVTAVPIYIKRPLGLIKDLDKSIVSKKNEAKSMKTALSKEGISNEEKEKIENQNQNISDLQHENKKLMKKNEKLCTELKLKIHQLRTAEDKINK